MSGSTWRRREGGRRVALEVPPHEAVVGDAELQGRRAAVLDGDGAVLLGEGEDAEDPAHAGFVVATVDGLTERADPSARPHRARQQREGGRRRALGLIGGIDRMPAARLAAVFARFS